MDSARGYSGHFKHYAFIWRPAFSQRQIGVYPSENQRYIARLPVAVPADATAQGRLATQRLATDRGLTAEEMIDKFTNNRCSDDIDRNLHRNLQIRKFLEDADIGTLLRPAEPVARAMALLDDRNSESVTRTKPAGNCRPFNGPLTANQLFLELSQERLPEVPENPMPGFIPAERRLVYVTDVDPHYALAIAVNSSIYQAAFLRDFIHKHLTSRALIGVDIWSPSPTGFATFSLEFHLPYYAWRCRLEMQEDSRHRADGKPLRRSEEVIPLTIKPDSSKPPNTPNDYTFEAEISVMVTGLDDWVWSAYCFVDVYFKDDNNNDMPEAYSNPQMRLDPHSGLSCGGNQANRPIWTPREYYLRALACRMVQVKQEWNNSVSRLIEQIEPNILAFTTEDTDVGKMNDITQEKGFKWTIRVLRQFSHLLSKTINAWDNFNSGEIRYFCRPGTDELAEASWVNYLAAIDKDVAELRDLQSSLQYQTELFENMTNSLVTHAQHAETIITRLQSEFIQALTVITIFYLPPTLASTIFSMQGVLPKGATLRDWGFTLLALFAITIIIVINLPYITTFGGKVRTWQGKGFEIVRNFVIRKILGRKIGRDGDREEGLELDELHDGESSDTGEV